MSLRAVAPLYNVTVKNRLKDVLPQVAANSIGSGVTNIVNGMTRLI